MATATDLSDRRPGSVGLWLAGTTALGLLSVALLTLRNDGANTPVLATGAAVMAAPMIAAGLRRREMMVACAGGVILLLALMVRYDPNVRVDLGRLALVLPWFLLLVRKPLRQPSAD